MNKEQQKLLNEAYKNYSKKMMYHPVENWLDDENGEKTYRQLSQDEFIKKCKTDIEFSQKWGLKIEERELSLDERYKIALPIWKEKYGLLANMMVPTNVDNTPYKIPTKLITITYNDKKIESYE